MVENSKRRGRNAGGVFTNEKDHWEFLADVMRETMVVNPLWIDEFIFVT